MQFLFCNKCRKRILPPKMLLKSNIKTEKPIKVGCADKKCGGHALFSVPQKEEVKEIEHVET